MTQRGLKKEHNRQQRIFQLFLRLSPHHGRQAAKALEGPQLCPEVQQQGLQSERLQRHRRTLEGVPYRPRCRLLKLPGLCSGLGSPR